MPSCGYLPSRSSWRSLTSDAAVFFPCRNYHINSARLRRSFDVICAFFQAFRAVRCTVARESNHCITFGAGTGVPLIRAGLHSAIAGSKRNFVLGDYMRSEHIDSLAQCRVKILPWRRRCDLGHRPASAREHFSLGRWLKQRRRGRLVGASRSSLPTAQCQQLMPAVRH